MNHIYLSNAVVVQMKNDSFKAHSHYCIFRVRLRQTVALLRRDRKIPISALTQSTAESADCCGECEWAFSNYCLAVGRTKISVLRHGTGSSLSKVCLNTIQHVAKKIWDLLRLLLHHFSLQPFSVLNGLFFIHFFLDKNYNNFTTNKCENDPSNLPSCDSKSQPLYH